MQSRQQLLRMLHILLLLALCTLSPAASPAATVQEIQQRKNIETLEKIEGLTEKERDDILRALEQSAYTTKRIFLALCTLPNIDRKDMDEALIMADSVRLSFDFIPLLENFTSRPDTSLKSTEKFLQRLQNNSFVSAKAVASLASFRAENSAQIFQLLDLIAGLDEAGQWAVQSLMRHVKPGPRTALPAIDELGHMSVQQSRAAEQLFQISDLDEASVLPALKRTATLTGRDAEIARSLFMQEMFSAHTLSFWFEGLFSRQPKARDAYFRTLSAENRKLLLGAYYDGASPFIWRINNLHDVTDSFGREIGSGRLAGYSADQLTELFRDLHPVSQGKYSTEFYTSLGNGKRSDAVNILRRVTADSRHRTAQDLSAAHIYALLANGSELYDSSFRDILVPILRTRTDSHYHGRLLDLLVGVDTSNLYISDFITGLAQKGKLTTFLPGDSERQKEILGLVSASALSDEESLILFSATFSRLLQSLQPDSRSHLIDLLIEGIDRAIPFDDQVQVILQHYLRDYPLLLNETDRQKIGTLLRVRGPIDLAPYIAAPFAEWREDRRLASLSVFQGDDDGRSSYISYCRTLLDSGYTPRVSTNYSGVSSSSTRGRLERLIDSNPSAIREFLRLSRRSPLAIDWRKRVNSVEVVHTVYVYAGAIHQEKLLKLFLQSGDEMFAQRGHSYWRYEQLFQPLESLVEKRSATPDIFEAKQRFISLGSCGGIRAYSRLNTLFRNNVDILATVGTGKATINNPYNRRFLELIANGNDMRTWQDVENRSAGIFSDNLGGDYIQPGSLPAILHKMRDETTDNGTD